MINFRVDDLDALLAQLRAAGVTVDERTDTNELGRFGWIMDPDGTRIELWQPPA
jgi:predicted enzyme related to lactoylglutathione lyase